MNNNGKPHELKNLRYGEYCVLIEFCTNCKEHNSSLRHDEQKYYDRAVALQTEIQAEFPFVKVYLKPLDTSIKGAKERLGLFEVHFGSFESPAFALVASKLKTLKWPEVRTVVNNIRALLRVKTVSVQFTLPKDSGFSARTDPLAGVKAFLVSSLDFPHFVQNMSAGGKTRASKTAKPDFKKERTLSSIVRRKIASGETKPEEIDDLLASKEFVHKLKIEDGVAEQHNVSPGNFVLFIAEDRNVKAQVQEVYVSPSVRDKDRHQHESIELTPQDVGVLNLHIGCESANPLIAVDLRRKGPGAHESADSSQMSLDGELVHVESGSRNGQPVASYNARQLQPGAYELFVEYSDYTTHAAELHVCVGHNELMLSYPDFKFVGDSGAEGKTARPKTVTPKTDMPVIMENVKGEDRLDGTMTHRNRDSDVYEAKTSPKAQVDEPNKENVSKNVNKSLQGRTGMQSDVSASNTSFESKSSRKPNDNYEQPIVSKNRITSGNRIRPGERLTSAKSNNMVPTVQNELARDRDYITVYTSSIVSDIVWDSLDYEPDLFNIFVKNNKALELRLDFVLEDDDISGVISEGKSSGFSHITLTHSPKVKLVRLYVEKVKDKIDEKVDIYINNKGRTHKIEISEFLKHNSKADERYCDICILSANKKSYDDFVSLVPLRAKVQNLTGLVELKNIVSFVQNSKFDIFKFFGFDETQGGETKDQVIGYKEAEDNLANYEIYCNDNYILNAVRYGDKDLISMRRLEKIYSVWVQLVAATGDLLDNMEDANGEDEPFEPDDFDESDFDG